MRDFLSQAESILLWGLFFATSLYGHVAVKLSVSRAPNTAGEAVLWTLLGDFRGWSAAVAWGLSAVLWSLAVARQGLMTANAIASLRYVLVSLVAWAFLSEEIRTVQGIGIALIVLGIALATPA